MTRVSKSERIEIWLDRLRRHSESTQTIAQFCAAEGVSAPSFYHWKRRLAAMQAKEQVTEKASPQTTPTAFTELQIVGQPSPALVTLPGGIHVQLGTDPLIATAIIDRVLQHACPSVKATPARSKSC